MHHGTCVTHVPWCMPGSLISSFLWSRWWGKRSWHSRRMRNPQFYVSGKRPMVQWMLEKQFCTDIFVNRHPRNLYGVHWSIFRGIHCRMSFFFILTIYQSLRAIVHKAQYFIWRTRFRDKVTWKNRYSLCLSPLWPTSMNQTTKTLSWHLPET